MLREVPGYMTPSMSPSSQPTPPHENEILDDVFGSAPPSPILESAHAHLGDDTNATAGLIVDTTDNSSAPTAPQHPRNPLDERSDIPRLRALHVTSGYRDGIAESKGQHVQAGFDEGFSLGAVLGLRAGFLLGALEGVVRAVIGLGDGGQGAEVRAAYVRAREELGLRGLFGREWFGEDGVWKFEVGQESGEDEVTFREVADAHPVVRKWSGEVEALAQRYGLVLEGRRRDDEDGADEGGL